MQSGKLSSKYNIYDKWLSFNHLLSLTWISWHICTYLHTNEVVPVSVLVPSCLLGNWSNPCWSVPYIKCNKVHQVSKLHLRNQTLELVTYSLIGSLFVIFKTNTRKITYNEDRKDNGKMYTIYVFWMLKQKKVTEQSGQYLRARALYTVPVCYKHSLNILYIPRVQEQ